MSWQAQAWAIEMGKRYELEPGHRWMLTILANYADPEGNDIYPSIGTLMADTGFGENTIRRHIKHLMACGLMEYGDQTAVLRLRPGNRPKVYRLTFTTVNPLTVGGSHHGGSQIGGSHPSPMGGPNRGATVEPKPKNLKEKPSCRSCDRSGLELTDSGLCPDCIGPHADAAASGAAYREQLRLARMARSVGRLPA